MTSEPDIAADAADQYGSRNLFSAARRRWKIVLLVFVLVFSAAAFYLSRQPLVYQASATIEVNSAAGPGSRGQSAADVMVSLKSRPLAEQVIQRLNLGWAITGYSPGLRVIVGRFVVSGSLPGLQIKLNGPQSFSVYDTSGRFVAEGEHGKLLETEGLSLLLHIENGRDGQTLKIERQPLEPHVDHLLSGLQIASNEGDADIITLTMRGEDPDYIRNAVNILIEIYQESLLQESSQELARVEGQIADVEDNLAAVEQKLRSYRQKNGLPELPQQGERLQGKATELSQRKTRLEWQRSQVDLAVERLQKAMTGGAAFIAPNFEGFPSVNDAANRLFRLEAEKRALLVDYTEMHPRVEEATAAVREAQQALLALYLNMERELSGGVQDLEETIAGLDAQLRQAPEVELARRSRDQAAQVELLSFLQDKQRELLMAKMAATKTVKIIDPAITPRTPVEPNRLKVLTLGGLLGLFLGLCCAYALSALDHTFKTVDEVRSKLNLPIFGVIPKIPLDNDTEFPVAVLAPKAPVVEAFRALRTRLHYLTGRERHKVIMVTSSLPGEGKSTLSANLAVVLGLNGAKVLLVGCDLRRPSLHKLFGQDHVPGLVELLRDKNQASVRHLDQPRLDFLPSGGIPENPSEILESQRMRHFLEMARELYDYVVIDAPPVLPVTDAEILAPLADINLVVLEPCRVPEKAARQMVRSLQDVGAAISGIVINDKTGQGFKYYGSYSYYGNRNFAGYYGENLDELQDGPLLSTAKKLWQKLNS